MSVTQRNILFLGNAVLAIILTLTSHGTSETQVQSPVTVICNGQYPTHLRFNEVPHNDQ